MNRRHSTNSNQPNHPTQPNHPSLTAPGTITLADVATLRGRGGGNFPVAAKAEAVINAAARTGKTPVLIINGTESDLFSVKDRYLLHNSPRTVLRGAVLMARLIGAKKLKMVVPPELVAPLRPLAAEAGIHVSAAATGFVAGQDSAVAAHLEGRTARPRRPHIHSTDSGYRRRPTYVGNVETFHCIALIEQGRDPHEYVLISVSSGVLVDAAPTNTQVIAMPSGMSVREILRALPEGFLAEHCSPDHHVLVGGMHGTWVPALTDRPAGSHSLFVPADYYPINVATSQILHRAADSSAGQCGPCALGLPRLAEAWDRLGDPRYGAEARETVDLMTGRRAPYPGSVGPLAGRGACSHPDGVSELTRSALALVAGAEWGMSQAAYVPDHWQEAYYA